MTSIVDLLCNNVRILKAARDIARALSAPGVTSTTSDSKSEVVRAVDNDKLLEQWDEVLLQLKRLHLQLFLLTGFDGIELDGALILPVKRHRLLPLAEVDDDLADLLHVREEQTSGTNGGTATAASGWEIKVLNTVVTNEISGSSLGSNQITLPVGTYFIEATSPATQVGRHKAKLYDTTAAADIIIGTSEFSSGVASGASTISLIKGRFTLGVQSDLEIRHNVEVDKATVGHGVASSLGTEVYTEVDIRKIS